MKSKCKLFFILILLLIIPQLLFSAQRIPEIKKLSIKDNYFKQLYLDIETNWKAKIQNNSPPIMHIFSYRIRPKDDFYKISASLSCPMETLATLNELENPHSLKTGDLVYIPNRQGLFIPDTTQTSNLCQFIKHTRFQQLKKAPSFSLKGKKFFFLENSKFNSVEQAFFLKLLYRYPISHGIITSGYGKRIHPITGKPSWHNGIDIAAPKGSPVYATNDGKVVDTGISPIYGNYILLRHKNGYDSFYGHLSKISCKKNSTVLAGHTIGLVGTTGFSTGPHLHFEIRKNGKALNPKDLLLN